MELDKIIPVDEEDIEIAKNKASEIFYNNELNSEYLDSRNVTFEEILSINENAIMMAKAMFDAFGNNLSKEEIKKYFYNLWKDSEYSSYVFDEMIKKLEEKYDYSFEKISI